MNKANTALTKDSRIAGQNPLFFRTGSFAAKKDFPVDKKDIFFASWEILFSGNKSLPMAREAFCGVKKAPADNQKALVKQPNN